MNISLRCHLLARAVTLAKISVATVALWLFAALLLAVASAASSPGAEAKVSSVFLTNNIERPLRYTPIGTDFVITNGGEFFNRPLYGGSSPFRVDGGDKPEFSLYLPGRGGNLRLGIKTADGVRWLNDAAQVVTRYRPGSLVHEIRDPLLGSATLTLTTVALSEVEGVIVRAEVSGKKTVELIFAFGGVNGMKGRRDGDIGCESQPVSEFFQLRADQCVGNQITIRTNQFQVQGKPGAIQGVLSGPAELSLADARDWNDPAKLLVSKNDSPNAPLLVGRALLVPGKTWLLGLQKTSASQFAEETLPVYQEVANDGVQPVKTAVPRSALTSAQLAEGFAQAENHAQKLRERLIVETPDPFINAAAAALSVAADAVWNDRQDAYLHGGVAWRKRLLGWRVSYAGDALGWPERTAKHFAGFAKQQNTSEIFSEFPAPEASANLSRNETALHSNGDLTQSHYDMNLVGVDAFFRHLLWTGDTNFARAMWPTIERHLAWERRLFRREFGPEKLPLYEAYCCIWASDDLAYNGGAATHSSAYNLYHNRLAARVAKLLGHDAMPYEREAELIARGMHQQLWLPQNGWFAEWKDLLGLQLVHPNAALWTFYHTIDSEVPTSLEAWQMTRFVDTQIARFPLQGPGVPEGNFTLPTTSWMPYTWSLNNVVMAEVTHTALAYWQANRAETAYSLLKGAVLDSMYLGLCPGNVGMCTYFDATRRESQRDFGDGVGATSRALVEGLFGVKPDLLAGEISIEPGFPSAWNHAAIRHPAVDFSFQRAGLTETFSVKTKFAAPLKLKLQIPALRDTVVSVTVNGQKVRWRMLEDSVGVPKIEINAAAASEQKIVVKWRGEKSVAAPSEVQLATAAPMQCKLGARILALADPQNALSHAIISGEKLSGLATGLVGHRTVFAKLEQGDLRWWQPVTFEIIAPAAPVATVDWRAPVSGVFEPVLLTGVFNDAVTQIFRNEYLAPRSPFCSLATPKQGFGSWCHPQDNFVVDDSGLRRVATQAGDKIVLPNGIPLATPGATDANNIAFVSRWNNYPPEISVPLKGKSAHAYLLLAGSTSAMQSRFDNGEVVVNYTDGSTARLALHNPTTWWPIDQDYYIDDFAFARPERLPLRVDLRTGKVRVLEMDSFKGKGGVVPGGAATVLELPLDPAKELSSLTVRALANEVVIGLMSVTLQR